MAIQNMNVVDANNNYLLSNLPEHEYYLIEQTLTYVEIQTGEQVVGCEQTNSEYLYYIVSGILSLRNAPINGKALEVAMIGREGVAGLCHAMIDGNVALSISAEGRVVYAYKQRVQDYQTIIDKMPVFSGRIQEYLVNMMLQIAQNYSCNKFHSVREFLYKWLLMRHDRMDGVLYLTHEKISELLNIRRASVTNILSDLQGQDILITKRGSIEIKDRTRLLEMVCDCYIACNM